MTFHATAMALVILATVPTNQKRTNPMTGLMFEVKITAVGEVRDKDGNLVSAEPVEFTQTVSEQMLRELQGEAS